MRCIYPDGIGDNLVELDIVGRDKYYVIINSGNQRYIDPSSQIIYVINNKTSEISRTPDSHQNLHILRKL